MKKQFQTFDEIKACVGQDVAISDWLTVTQTQIDQFAVATNDHQWIHIDKEKAAAGQHRYHHRTRVFDAVFVAEFFESAYANAQTRMGINYGLNKVRFTAPVPVDSRLRGHLHLLACEDIEPKGIQMTWRVTVEREGSDKPVCVAESLVRHYA